MTKYKCPVCHQLFVTTAWYPESYMPPCSDACDVERGRRYRAEHGPFDGSWAIQHTHGWETSDMGRD